MTDIIQQQVLAVKDNLSLQEAYRTMMTANQSFLGSFHTVLNVLCILFILLNFLRAIQQQPFVFSTDKKSALSPVFLISNIALIFAILFYQQIFGFCEDLLVGLSDEIITGAASAQEIWSECLEEFFVQANWDTATKLVEHHTALDPALSGLETVGNAAGFTLSPNVWAYGFCAISTVVSFFNYLMSFAAYVDRSLVLLLLNTLSPIAFAITILPEYRKVTVNFFAMLLTVMLVYPFILIGFSVVDILYVRFCGVLGITGHSQGLGNITGIISQQGGSSLENLVEQLNYSIFLKLPLLLFLLFLKFKYLQLIAQTIWKILKT